MEQVLMDDVEWTVCEKQLPFENPDNLPTVTHSGLFDFFGDTIKCYRLSTGQAIFDAEDFKRAMNQWFDGRGQD